VPFDAEYCRELEYGGHNCLRYSKPAVHVLSGCRLFWLIVVAKVVAPQFALQKPLWLRFEKIFFDRINWQIYLVAR